MTVASSTPSTSGLSNCVCRLIMTLSIKYRVEWGSTSAAIRLIAIRPKPPASSARRGRTNSHTRGNTALSFGRDAPGAGDRKCWWGIVLIGNWILRRPNMVQNLGCSRRRNVTASQPGPQLVQHVPAQRVPRRQLRVVEIVGGIVRHTEFFHHTAGAKILRNREAHKFFDLEKLKRIFRYFPCAFRGKALSPEFRQ